LRIGHATVQNRASDANESLAIIRFAVVVAVRLLVQVPEQMERFDADIGSLESALQEAPEILDLVRVHVAINVTLCVIDDLMNVVAVESVIADPCVRENVRAAFHIAANMALERATLCVR